MSHPDNPLRHGRLGEEHGPGDFPGAEAADCLQQDGHDGVDRQAGIGAREHQVKRVLSSVATAIVH